MENLMPVRGVVKKKKLLKYGRWPYSGRPPPPPGKVWSLIQKFLKPNLLPYSTPNGLKWILNSSPTSHNLLKRENSSHTSWSAAHYYEPYCSIIPQTHRYSQVYIGIMAQKHIFFMNWCSGMLTKIWIRGMVRPRPPPPLFCPKPYLCRFFFTRFFYPPPRPPDVKGTPIPVFALQKKKLQKPYQCIVHRLTK